MRARDDIAAHLKRLRQHHDPPLTQAQAAALVGVDIRHYGNWERGKTTPRLANLLRVAEVFDIQAGELLEPAATEDNDTAQALSRLETMLTEVLARLNEHGLTLPTPTEVAEQAAQRREQQPAAATPARRGRRRSAPAR